jgi:hypothetical protein
MDPPRKDPPVAAQDDGATFSVADYKADPGRVIAHAAATGRAVVVSEDGRPQVIINIPIVDLPTLDY